MKIKAQLGEPAPLFSISEWVQGEPVNLDRLTGRVVLLEVFQVNCPGCFIYALPQATELHQDYEKKGLSVIGIATAFEDFDKNTLENLRLLAQSGQVIGETLHHLAQQGMLNNGCLPYAIPFPLAMDRLVKRESVSSSLDVERFIHDNLKDFHQFPADSQRQIREQVRNYLENLKYHAETFERFGLKGTPSQILIDKKGILREIHFGVHSGLETKVQQLLAEE